VHFNALRELRGSSAMGMCTWTPVECCSWEHSKGNLVSRLCRGKAADARTNEAAGQIARRQLPFQTLSQYRYKIAVALLGWSRMERYATSD
jgi:hypothetical protein